MLITLVEKLNSTTCNHDFRVQILVKDFAILQLPGDIQKVKS